MQKIKKGLFVVCTMLLVASCTKDAMLEQLEQIKAVGDTNPQTALAMADSLKLEIREHNEYIQAKYDLLQIRLNDKADNLPISDIIIKKLVDYFEQNGTKKEKQEVYYYAGSTYRDLHDSPQALSAFFKSLDFAKELHDDCDSAMLRNTYSNLSYLNFRVQNYSEAAEMAKKELTLRKKLRDSLVLPYMHIGSAYYALDSTKRAIEYFDSVYSIVVEADACQQNQESLTRLMAYYAQLGKEEKAKACRNCIIDTPLNELPNYTRISFALYYELMELNDSIELFCNEVLNDSTDLVNMYDAAKIMFRTSKRNGDMQRTAYYAEKFLLLSDSLDFGKRQELAATVNNEHNYHLDQKREQKLKEEKQQLRNILFLVTMTSLLVAGFAIALYYKRKNNHLQEILRLSSELQRVKNDENILKSEIQTKEKDLVNMKRSLNNSSNELSQLKEELNRVNGQLREYDETLKRREMLLSEKIDQNKAFIKLLHQSELEGKAEDIIHAVRQASVGKKNMNAADWKQLYQAVDELYPKFKDRMLKTLGSFSEQQMQVCYLIRIGLSNTQIQNMTDLSRVTIWRWVKKYDWVLTPDGK